MNFPILLPNIFNHPFTYESNLKLQVGDFVEVPFGKSQTTGVVWNEFEKINNKNFKIKKISKKLNIPGLKKDTLKFLNWFSDYNIVPKGMALKLLLLKGNLIQKYDKKFYKDYIYQSEKSSINLSKEQKKSLDEILNSNKKFKVHVLQGTTGSGKTIVYFEALKKN